jgi:hypothetical protein
MRQRKRIIECTIKANNNVYAARRYHTTRWRKRYDGTIESLRKKSTHPHSHPNQHTAKELELIRHMYKYHGYKCLAHVFRKCTDASYERCYDSMYRQIRKMKLNNKRIKRTIIGERRRKH